MNIVRHGHGGQADTALTKVGYRSRETIVMDIAVAKELVAVPGRATKVVHRRQLVWYDSLYFINSPNATFDSAIAITSNSQSPCG